MPSTFCRRGPCGQKNLCVVGLFGILYALGRRQKFVRQDLRRRELLFRLWKRIHQAARYD